eukprot:6211892-Pleurochrysis_carterae.AAC.4
MLGKLVARGISDQSEVGDRGRLIHAFGSADVIQAGRIKGVSKGGGETRDEEKMGDQKAGAGARESER